MKKSLILSLGLLFAIFFYAADATGAEDPFDELKSIPAQDTLRDELTEEEEKSLDEIVEDENWKKRLPMTDWDWNWNDEELPSKKGQKRGYFRGGAGGWDVYYLPLDLAALNSTLSTTGITPFVEEIYMVGGGGFGFVGKKIRIGGLGTSGEVIATGTMNGLQKEVKLKVGFGGFTIDKVFHPFNKTEIACGLMIGGGSADLKFTQWSGPVFWSDIVSGYSATGDSSAFFDHQNSLSTNFFSLMPSVSLRYNVFRWFAVGAHVGYLYTRMDQRGWRMEGKKIEGFPDLDFSNVMYRLSFYFGG